MDEWLIIHTPTGSYCWPITPADEADRADLVNRGRVLAGLPAVEVSPGDSTGYAVIITWGEPHPTLMDQATIGTTDDLRAVDTAAALAHQAERDEAAQQARLAEISAAVAAMSDDDRAALLAALNQQT